MLFLPSLASKGGTKTTTSIRRSNMDTVYNLFSRRGLARTLALAVIYTAATATATSAFNVPTYQAFGAMLSLPAAALMQGAYFLTQYRKNFDDAPLPLSPAHGVVVVSPDDCAIRSENRVAEKVLTMSDGSSSSSADSASDPGTSRSKHWEYGTKISKNKNQVTDSGSDRENTLYGVLSKPDRRGHGWRAWRYTNAEDVRVIQSASQQAPLRLLVIGDSLAAGVGTSSSCTPILPEVIARCLSKALDGRAVYWTCVGEPGAAAGWIVRQLNSDPTDANGDSISLHDRTVADRSSKNKISDQELNEQSAWRERLDLHCEDRKSHPYGQYDVAVVLTGINDIKGAILPFMLQGQEAQYYKEAKSRGGGYSNELKLVLDALGRKMKLGLKESLEKVRIMMIEENGENEGFSAFMSGEVRDQVSTSILEFSAKFFVDDPNREEEIEYPNDTSVRKWQKINSSNNELSVKTSRPMVVLPALPVKLLPFLKWPPLRWFGVPLIGIIAEAKRKLSEDNPGLVLFVKEPKSSEIDAFEDRIGPLWDSLEKEITLLSLNDACQEDCEVLEREMREYYASKMELGKGLSGRDSTPLLCPDGIHPSDMGYDFFGRHIAASIVQEWET